VRALGSIQWISCSRNLRTTLNQGQLHTTYFYRFVMLLCTYILCTYVDFLSFFKLSFIEGVQYEILTKGLE
jgi:hypothetical protein